MSGLFERVPRMGEIGHVDALFVAEVYLQVVWHRLLLEVAGLEGYLHRTATGLETMLSETKAGVSEV